MGDPSSVALGSQRVSALSEYGAVLVLVLRVGRRVLSDDGCLTNGYSINGCSIKAQAGRRIALVRQMDQLSMLDAIRVPNQGPVDEPGSLQNQA